MTVTAIYLPELPKIQHGLHSIRIDFDARWLICQCGFSTGRADSAEAVRALFAAHLDEAAQAAASVVDAPLDRMKCLLDLAHLAEEGLPTIEAIEFTGNRQASLTLSSIDDLRWWALGLGHLAEVKAHNHPGNVRAWCSAERKGWSILLDASEPLPVEELATAERPLVISDSTIAEAERLERLHTHDGRDCYCETPDAVSPERVAELCAKLNAFPSPGAADAHLRSQPEFHRVLNVTEFDLIFDAELIDGSTITHSARNGWTWER